MPLPIGAVIFKRSEVYLDLMGDERVEMLRKFYRREPLPEGVVAWGDWYSVNRPIQWEEVYWQTAGTQVTGGFDAR